MKAATCAAAAGISPDAWRQSVLDATAPIIGYFVAAEDIGESRDPVGHMLASTESELHVWLEVLKAEAPSDQSAHTALQWFKDIQTQIEAAAALLPQTVPRRAVLQAAIQQCAQVARLLDAPQLPKIGREEYYRQQFMRGKALGVDLLKAVDVQKHDGEFEARFRPRGRRQNTEAMDRFLDHLRYDFGAQEGASAVLTGYLSCVMDGAVPVDLDYLHRHTYEEWAGGPDTVYADEVDDDEAGAPTSAQPLTGWRAEVATLIERAEDAMGSAVQIELDYNNGPAARRLVYEAQKVLDAAANLLTSGTADAYFGEMDLAESMILGARDMSGTHPGLQAMLQVAVDAFKAAADILDAADLLPGTDDPRAPEGPTVAPVFSDPTEQRLDALLKQLDAYLEGLEHVGIGDAYDKLHSMATCHFWDARNGLDEHNVAVALAALPLLRDGLMAIEWLMGEGNPGWPLVRECVTLINQFLGDDGGGGDNGGDNDGPHPSRDDGGTPSVDGGRDFPDDDRVEVAHQGVTFIDRLVSHFQKPGRQGTMGDLAAIRKSASVIMSALTDPVEEVESLRARLEDALESASVILQEQPPAYWKSPGILRQRDVGKRVVGVLHAA